MGVTVLSESHDHRFLTITKKLLKLTLTCKAKSDLSNGATLGLLTTLKVGHMSSNRRPTQSRKFYAQGLLVLLTALLVLWTYVAEKDLSGINGREGPHSCGGLMPSILFSSFPSGNPLYYLPSPCFCEGTPSPTHPLLPPCSGIALHWCIDPFQDQRAPLYWYQAKPSPAKYEAGAMGFAMCTRCSWFSPWDLYGVWLIDIVVLSIALRNPSAPSFFP